MPIEPISATAVGAAIAKGIAVKAITSIAGKIFEVPEYKETLIKTIDKSIDETSYTFEWKGSQREEEVCIFLDSQEVQQLVEQMFSVKALEKDIKTFNEIEDEFVFLFALFFGKISNKDKTHVRSLFKLLLDNLVKAIDGLIEDKETRMILSLLTYQHNRFESLIQSISQNNIFLNKEKLPRLKEINEFEEKYRAQLYDRFSSITLSNLDTERKININDIYVNPKLFGKKSVNKWAEVSQPFSLGKIKIETKHLDIKPENISIKLSDITIQKKYSWFGWESKKITSVNQEELYKDFHRVIILGNPGGGKSTLTYKICTDLEEHYKEGLINGKILSPIHVKIRDYGEQKSKNNFSIVQFIESVSNASYQLPPPTGVIEYLLHNGRALVIFDGLDELLDTGYRKDVVEDIESFCNLYPSTPVLITSREVGYEQAPLNEKNFQVFRLTSFDDEQVEDYAHKYFNLEKHLTKEQKTETAKSFLQESEIAKDIRSNPLMLGLMCSIYRGEKYIPQNKPQLYEKCSVMLFERWDKSRKINYPYEKFAAHIKPGMMYLAHWIYTNENLQSGVQERQLIQKTADYLEAYYPNRNEAEFVAKDFVDFCSGRAWVFTDIGQGVFQFTHQTFLEYFTACYLTKIHRTPKEIAKVLLPKIEKREWDVVAHLTLNILNDNPTEISDEIIAVFLDNFEKKKRYATRLNILNFVVSSLDYAVLTYKTIERIVETTINFFLESVAANITNNKSHTDNIPENLIHLLFVKDSRNKESIWTIAEDYLLSKIKNSNDKEKRNLIHLIDFVKGMITSKNEEIRKKLIEPSDELLSTIDLLEENNLDDAIIKYDNHLINLEKLFDLHGLEAFCRRKLYFGLAISNYYDIPMFLAYGYLRKHQEFIRERLNESHSDFFESRNKPILELLRILNEKFSFDILDKFKISLSSFERLDCFNISRYLPVNSDKDNLFAKFLLLALLYEFDSELLIQLDEEKLGMLPTAQTLSFVFPGRENFDKYKEQVEFEINNSGLTDMQKSVIWQWVHKEVSFLNSKTMSLLDKTSKI